MRTQAQPSTHLHQFTLSRTEYKGKQNEMQNVIRIKREVYITPCGWWGLADHTGRILVGRAL